MYYENNILINIEIPNFEEIKKKYFDNEGSKIVFFNDIYSIRSPFKYFTPVMNVDPDGHSPEWWQWLLSGVAVVAVIALSATGIGGILGGVLIGAGAGSMINGYVNEANGGSFTAGYWGGAISGALCGVGAGLGGLAFGQAITALKGGAYYLAALFGGQGAILAFAGGFIGNYVGSCINAFMDSTMKPRPELLNESIACGIINVASSAYPSFEIGKSSSPLERFLAANSAVMSESASELLSMFILALMEL